jgi:hypothetical protein
MLSPGPLEGGWQVVMPLPVDVEVDETGYVVVSDAVFAVYGDGSSFEAAWRDYRTSLAEYCAMVRADATRGPEDEREYQRLLTYIQPCVGTR